MLRLNSAPMLPCNAQTRERRIEVTGVGKGRDTASPRDLERAVTQLRRTSSTAESHLLCGWPKPSLHAGQRWNEARPEGGMRIHVTQE